MKNINFNNELRQLADALLRVQTKIGTVKQNTDNPYFNSTFANLETCWEYVRPFFNDEGILIQQIVHETDSGVSIETLFIGYGTQLSGGKLPVPAIKTDPQAYGSAVTYAKRYSLLQACGIASAKEDVDGEKARVAFDKEQSTQKPKEGYSVKNLQGGIVINCKTEHDFLEEMRKQYDECKKNGTSFKGTYLMNKKEIQKACESANDKDKEGYKALIEIGESA